MFIINFAVAVLRTAGDIVGETVQEWLDTLSTTNQTLGSGLMKSVCSEKWTRYYFQRVPEPLPENWPLLVLGEIGRQNFLIRKRLGADISRRGYIRFLPRSGSWEQEPVLRQSENGLCLEVPYSPALSGWDWDMFAREIAAALETLAAAAGPGERDAP